MGGPGRQRERDRARLYRHQQHRRFAGRRDPQPADIGAHPGRALGRPEGHCRGGRLPRLASGGLCERPYPRGGWRVAGPLTGRRPVLAGLAAMPLLMAQRAPGPRPVETFLGIRYGRAERFRAPRPVFDPPLGRYGPSCPQQGRPELAVDEDCLFLNIWTPARDGRRRPVLVYFHGGAYSTGTPVSPHLDPAPPPGPP